MLKITQKQLTNWNAKQFLTFGISCNENVNVRDGLPNPEARIFLRNLHYDIYGICNPSGKITMKHIKESI
ncbi:MAG: hypothetical protein WCP55_15990 [Lentisphaerota bacterium]